MPNKKNLKRTIFEGINMYIYIIAPALVIIIYCIVNKYFDINLNEISTFNEEIINISLALTGILLTLMGLFASLPNSEFIKKIKKYNHDKILYRTLFLGVISLLSTILISSIELFEFLKPILFLIGFTETFISSIKIYLILSYLDN